MSIQQKADRFGSGNRGVSARALHDLGNRRKGNVFST